MQTNNVTDVWGAPAKVNTFQDLAKLPIIKTEVSAKPVLEEKTMTKKELIRAALEYSLKHPTESTVSVAKKYGIADTALYNARHRLKAKLKKPVKDKFVMMGVYTNDKPLKHKSFHEAVASLRKDDNVNHPAHYKTGGIETIDFIEAKQLTYNLGNVVKYVTRAGVKNKATHIEDLEKAAWYLNREINNLKGGV